MSRFIVNMVSLDAISQEKIQEASDLGVKIITMDEVIQTGSDPTDAPEFIEPQQDDCYILSYTSGTTGDSKGVKMTHKMILNWSRGPPEESVTSKGDSVISFLPMPHSYE